MKTLSEALILRALTLYPNYLKADLKEPNIVHLKKDIVMKIIAEIYGSRMWYIFQFHSLFIFYSCYFSNMKSAPLFPNVSQIMFHVFDVQICYYMLF